jgi:hypothetical protein
MGASLVIRYELDLCLQAASLIWPAQPPRPTGAERPPGRRRGPVTHLPRKTLRTSPCQARAADGQQHRGLRAFRWEAVHNRVRGLAGVRGERADLDHGRVADHDPRVPPVDQGRSRQLQHRLPGSRWVPRDAHLMTGLAELPIHGLPSRTVHKPPRTRTTGFITPLRLACIPTRELTTRRRPGVRACGARWAVSRAVLLRALYSVSRSWFDSTRAHGTRSSKRRSQAGNGRGRGPLNRAA